LREWAGILVFVTCSIQCAARHVDISAFAPLQDLGFGRRAARLAVQCESGISVLIFAKAHNPQN